MQDYGNQNINLQLKFNKNKVVIRRGPLPETVTTLLLKLLKQRLIDVTSYRLSKLHFCIILDLFCSDAPIILVLFIQNLWVVKFMRRNS
jgi:hypothetical protein